MELQQRCARHSCDGYHVPRHQQGLVWTTANDIYASDFKQMMNDLKEQGFEAINATQLADFLDHNAKIPARSVLLIADDRHSAENFNEHFRPLSRSMGLARRQCLDQFRRWNAM